MILFLECAYLYISDFYQIKDHEVEAYEKFDWLKQCDTYLIVPLIAWSIYEELKDATDEIEYVNPERANNELQDTFNDESWVLR